MSNLNKIDPRIFKFTLPYLKNTLLFGNPTFNETINTLILDATIEYILSTKIFEEPLFESNTL